MFLHFRNLELPSGNIRNYLLRMWNTCAYLSGLCIFILGGGHELQTVMMLSFLYTTKNDNFRSF